jgi:hypothetical protein
MTAVSKANPTIKKILDATVGSNYRGRKISVDQVDPHWTYHLYNDTGEPHVYRVVLGRYTTARRLPSPTYGGPATIIGAPSGGEVVLTRQLGPTGTITIYMPRLDENLLDVARDALMAKGVTASRALTAELGPYGGIAEAIVGSETKTLGKVSSGKSSRQLDQEIAEIVGRSRRR